MSLVVISFDGVKDTEFEKMAHNSVKYPNIAKFMASCNYTGGVPTVFVSNTYPIHTSIVTGKQPKDHGIISNLKYINEYDEDVWAQEANLIAKKTIYQAAAQKKLTVGAISWPVTCGAKIKWNLPEAHLVKGQKRLPEQMRHGSVFFQALAFIRHSKKLKGIKEPELDDFLTSVAVDMLTEKKPDLALIHLIAYDDICHKIGICDDLDIARESLDKNLGRIMEVCGDSTVIIFSDHGHLNVNSTINLQELFKDALKEQCGGCAFFDETIDNIESYPWFGRFLTEQEIFLSGYGGVAFGVAAKPGFCFAKKHYASNHGYPLDYEDYNVFYAIKNNKKSIVHLHFKDIRNVTELIKRELDLDMDLV